ncbi:hypothetical protein OH781_01325 [Streptomyces sp. NBC_01550]
MPRPLWTGAISFGLVAIPIKIISATADHGDKSPDMAGMSVPPKC